MSIYGQYEQVRDINQVAIWTDGMGTYQPRCMDCGWMGKWTRTNQRAVEQAKTHGRVHAELSHAAQQLGIQRLP